MAKRSSRRELAGASELIFLCLASCEGKHRPYPGDLLRQADAASETAPERAEPALTPAAGTSPSEAVGEGARLPSLDTSPAGSSPNTLNPEVDTPNPEVSKPTEDAGAAANPIGCDCSNSPATPLCKTTTDGNPTLLNTCVECLSSADCASAAASRCDQQTGRCSGCRGNGDCSSIAGKPICSDDGAAQCVECVVDTDCTNNPSSSKCNTVTNTCAQCVLDSDCPTPSASRCADNRCQPCVNDSGDSHCGHIASGNTVLGVCDTSGAAGVCVQCTGTQSAACGASICDSLARACSPFPAGTARICQTCISDASCPANDRCVLETFDLTTLGYACFPLAQNGTCGLTPFAGLTRVNTIDGAIEDVCLLRRTTCAAFNALELQSCTMDADCGETNLNDGRCVTDGSLGMRCSIPCSNGADCPSNDDRTCLGACVFDF